MIKAKFIRCDGCKRMYTQTVYKNKESITVCPNCKYKNQKKHEKKIEKKST